MTPRPHRITALLFIAFASTAFGAGAAQGQDETSWPGLQGGAAHVGVFSDPRLRPPLRVLWRSSSPGDGRLSSVVLDGSVGFATAPNAVVRFRVGTGAIEWRLPRTPGPLIPPVIDPAAGREGLVVFTEGSTQRDAAVKAVDVGSRRTRWTAKVGPVGLGGPTAADGRVFVGTTRQSVIGIDGGTGDLLWTVRTDGPVNTAPAVADDRVFAVSENRQNGRVTLYALRAGGCGSPSCRPLWTFSPPGIAVGTSAPTVTRSTVYVAFGDASVRALDASTGRVRWTGSVRRLFSPRTTPAITGNELYVVDGIGGVFRFDATSGRRIWDYQFAATVTSGAPLVVPGRPSIVYVGLDDGTVAAIQGDTGHLRWRTRAGSAPVAGFAAATTDTDALLLAPVVGRRGGLYSFVHDPRGTLIDEESPTTLDLGRALLNFAAASVALMALLFVFFRLLPLRQQPGPEPPTTVTP
ncbi:MAG TPA: PQQ-binding-like beta-propeller repeat protein [Actinomycetota bacterium]|nr:PQQ-binding-like beta-propeller repeat protein [Actinomycetota bacterium]